MTGFAISDLFRLRWLGTPQLAPDGRHLAYLETTLDESADEVRHQAIVLTVATGNAHRLDIADPAGLAWAPNSRRLAIAARSGGWLDGGTGLRRVLDQPATDAAWSPDGARVAFTDGVRLWVVRPAEVREMETPQAAHPRWSPDGRWLSFIADGAPWLVPADLSARPRTITVPPEAVDVVAWSPDGRRLACLGHADDRFTDVGRGIWIVEIDGGHACRLSGLGDAALGSALRGDDPRGTDPTICWSACTGRIYVETALHGRGPLAWFDPDAERSGLLLDGEHAVLAPSVSTTGTLAAVISGPDGPGDLWLVDELGKHQRRVTDTGSTGSQAALPTRHVAIEHDGGIVDAWLTGETSRSGTGTPLVVNVHGGPYYAVGWRFTFEVQRLATRGLLVATLNPRGSAGRGDAFAAGNRGDWGGADAADVTAAVDALTGRPEVDAHRIALWGVSYGGFMTQWLLAQSQRFCSGISENGISDFRAIWRDRPGAFWELALGGAPADTTRYDERSPIRHAARIRTPLLLVHAEQDATCPIAQSTRMAEAVPGAALMRLPGEGHLVNLVGRPSSRLRRATAVDDWLTRTLR